MALAFVLDEHLRGPIWDAVVQHNRLASNPLDIVRVGDPPELPLGSADGDILLWAERESRIVLTDDRHTMPPILRRHLENGNRSPGVIILPKEAGLRAVLQMLEVIAYAGGPEDFADIITYLR